jgi:AraC-like DNA-binding protein
MTRIEDELGRRIRAGDARGAAIVLSGWLVQCDRQPGMTADRLRSRLLAGLLFVGDVVARRRLRDGSVDWLDGQLQPLLDALPELCGAPEPAAMRDRLTVVFERLVSRPESLLERAEGYLAHHYADPALQLRTMATAISASPYHIAHLFQRDRQTTFLRQVTALRLRAARGLLAETALPVEEVAVRAGYPNATRLRTVFKRHLGCSPSAYRRACQ